MNINEIILATDFGDTIEARDDKGVKVELPRAMEVLRRCVASFKAVYIISKVNDRQRQEVVEWITEHKLHEVTGILPENVFFCPERRDKGPIAARLNITHMIDDRPEVMVYMPDSVCKILINPSQADVQRWHQKRCLQVSDWTQIEKILFG